MSHFLAIDDEALVLKSLSMLLEALGHSVVAVSSGDEAIDRLRDNGGEPDAIIADYRLRNSETGVVAVAKVRAVLHSAVPALILTGDTAPEQVMEIHRSGLKMLHKPVGIQELLGALDDLIASSGGNMSHGQSTNMALR